MAHFRGLSTGRRRGSSGGRCTGCAPGVPPGSPRSSSPSPDTAQQRGNNDRAHVTTRMKREGKRGGLDRVEALNHDSIVGFSS